MVELSQIETGQLLYLFKSVHESIPVYEKLPRCFGNIEAVLEELLYSEQCFMVERLYGIFLENFISFIQPSLFVFFFASSRQECQCAHCPGSGEHNLQSTHWSP